MAIQPIYGTVVTRAHTGREDLVFSLERRARTPSVLVHLYVETYAPNQTLEHRRHVASFCLPSALDRLKRASGVALRALTDATEEDTRSGAPAEAEVPADGVDHPSPPARRLEPVRPRGTPPRSYAQMAAIVGRAGEGKP